MLPTPTTSRRRNGALQTMPGTTPTNRGKKFPAEVYTQAEMRALLAAFSRRGSAGIRDTALTALLYRCGPRINEALTAPLADLDLAGGTFYVRYPKRDKKGRARPRRVGVDAETAALLERWLARRRALGIPRSSPLFCQIQQPTRGEPLMANAYRRSLHAAGDKAGIDKRMHPHGLRHTFAFDWLQEGRPLDQLQALLGHRRLGTTAHYAQHLNPAVALDAHRARAWDDTAAAATAAGATPELLGLLRSLVEQQLAAAA